MSLPQSLVVLLAALTAACASTHDDAPLVLLENEGLEFGEVIHGLATVQGPESLKAGQEYYTPWLMWPSPFRELVLSWNVKVPEGMGLAFQVRVQKPGGPTPWLHLGDCGLPFPGQATEFDGGRVNVDVLQLEDSRGQLQLRLLTQGNGVAQIDRLTLCFTGGDIKSHGVPREVAPIPLPSHSQTTLGPNLSSRTCSPVSVWMVLEGAGKTVRPEQLFEATLDPHHDIYGNWPRAVQAAYEWGVEGCVLRLSSWESVAELLERGVPLVISLKAEEGELSGAPYPRTDGHLLVLHGLTADGRAHVLDPAARSDAAVARTYSCADLERCWLGRGRGLAYALGWSPR